MLLYDGGAYVLTGLTQTPKTKSIPKFRRARCREKRVLQPGIMI